jgi:hypothetical protein
MSEVPEWLTADERAVYLATLPKLQRVSPEILDMLAAYANAVVNLRRVRKDPRKARVWRGAMIYCRNGLGFGNRLFIDLMELLLDCGEVNELEVVNHLKPEWMIQRPGNYLTAEPNF